MMGATESGQKVTAENVHELPPGSVVRMPDGERIIHLHDDLWLWCCDHAWMYGKVEDMQSKLRVGEGVLCHIPVPKPH